MYWYVLMCQYIAHAKATLGRNDDSSLLQPVSAVNNLRSRCLGASNRYQQRHSPNRRHPKCAEPTCLNSMTLPPNNKENHKIQINKHSRVPISRVWVQGPDPGSGGFVETVT